LPQPKKTQSYCAAQVKGFDKDRYLAILLAPATAREHLFSLYAFNIEISKIRESVSETLLGEMRLAWWREAIDAIYQGDVPDHPVAEALERAIVECVLPQNPFFDLIDARQFDLYDEPMKTVVQFDAYAGATSSVLFQLAGFIVAGAKAVQAADASGHAGVAYALQGLIRAAPVHAGRGQLYLPVEVLEHSGVDMEDYFNRKMTPALGSAFGELHDIAHYHLAKAQEYLATLPSEAFAAFLPASLIKPYLKKISTKAYDPFTRSLEVSQLVRQWTLWRALVKGKLG
jgi:15-cis-phytoene synthase